MKVSTLQLAVERIEEELGRSPPNELPSVIGELERLKVMAQARLYGNSVNGPGPSTGDEWLTVEEAAKHLKLSVFRIYELCRMKDGLPGKRFGKNLRLLKSDVDAWGKAGGHEHLSRGKAR